jgi:hypothetical protein
MRNRGRSQGNTQCNHQSPPSTPSLAIKATGRGAYQRTRINAYGFPRGYLMREKSAFGFRTGDMVRAEVPSGKRAGVHIGRVAIRKRGSFNIQTLTGVVPDVAHRHCRKISHADGYSYQQRKGGASSPC